MKNENICPLITVNDILKSKEFYMNILKQEVELDHGENIAFKSGLAIHDKNHFQKLTGKQIEGESRNNMELYFQSDDIDNLEEVLESFNVEFIHKIIEQPWGQRVMRFYDPDDYIIEIGEPIEVVIKRFAAQGLVTEEISEKSSMPVEYVKMVLNLE